MQNAEWRQPPYLHSDSAFIIHPSPVHLPHASEDRHRGAGSVGATIAYACIIRGVGQHVVLYDTNRGKVDAEVLDLNHGLQFVPMATIEGSDDAGSVPTPTWWS